MSFLDEIVTLDEKSDLIPLAGGVNFHKYVRAEDWNAHRQALIDLRAAVLALQSGAISSGDVTALIAAAIATHEGASNPHPVYLTQAEGDALYQVTGSVGTFTVFAKNDGSNVNDIGDLPAGQVDNAAWLTSAAIQVVRFKAPGGGFGIGGVAGGTPGRILVLQHYGTTGLMSVAHEGASSLAANRFRNAVTGDVSMVGGAMHMWQYDGNLSRWVSLS